MSIEQGQPADDVTDRCVVVTVTMFIACCQLCDWRSERYAIEGTAEAMWATHALQHSDGLDTG